MRCLVAVLTLLILGTALNAQYPQYPPRHPRGSIGDMIHEGLNLGLEALRREIREDDDGRRKPPQPLPLRKPHHDYGGQQMWAVYEAASRLTSELEHVLEDISYEARTPQLYQQADRTLRQAMHFKQSLRPSVGRQHLYRDFQALDQQVHTLVDMLRSSNRAALQRGAARITSADEHLHHALSFGDDSAERRRDVIIRQARLLENEARELARAAVYALEGKGRHLVNVIERFADEAKHFRQSAEREASREHLVRDFTALDRTWHHIVRDLQQAGASTWVLRRAEDVNLVHNQLHRLFGAETEPTIIHFNFDS